MRGGRGKEKGGRKSRFIYSCKAVSVPQSTHTSAYLGISTPPPPSEATTLNQSPAVVNRRPSNHQAAAPKHRAIPARLRTSDQTASVSINLLSTLIFMPSLPGQLLDLCLQKHVRCPLDLNSEALPASDDAVLIWRLHSLPSPRRRLSSRLILSLVALPPA